MERRLTREIDLDTGVIVMDAFRLDGKLHRDANEGPAQVERNGNYLTAERYYWHGRLHREFGPAKVLYGGSDGVIMMEEMYYKHGVLHRDPRLGPAWIERYGNGLIQLEVYYVNGKPFRDPKDGPYAIGHYDDGRLEYETYSTPEEAGPSRRPHRKPGKGPAP